MVTAIKKEKKKQAKINKHINYVSNHRTSLRTLWWEESNTKAGFAAFQCSSWWALLTFRDKWTSEIVFGIVNFCISSSRLKTGWCPSSKESRWSQCVWSSWLKCIPVLRWVPETSVLVSEVHWKLFSYGRTSISLLSYSYWENFKFTQLIPHNFSQ